MTKLSKTRTTNTLLITVLDTKAALCENYERPREYMEKAARRILKSNKVKLEGRFRLKVGQGIPNAANKKNVASAEPRVPTRTYLIVRPDSDSKIIEGYESRHANRNKPS